MSLKLATKTEEKRPRSKKQRVVDEVLDEIYQEHGCITVDLFLDEARDPEHPCHEYFEWNDKTAAEKFRRQQAYTMIMASKMVAVFKKTKGKPPPEAVGRRPEVRRLVNVFRGEGFMLREDAMADENTREAMVERYTERLRSWCRATVDVCELADLRHGIMDLIGDK